MPDAPSARDGVKSVRSQLRSRLQQLLLRSVKRPQASIPTRGGARVMSGFDCRSPTQVGLHPINSP